MTTAADLEDRLGHRFGDTLLLERALTHRSWCAEHAGALSNERLEFLGDAVIGLIVAHRLHERFQGLCEGELAKARASLVSAATLAEAAREIGLGDMMRLGKGEDATGGRRKPSLLCDAVEAVIGAVYLDGGIQAAELAVERLLGDRMEDEALSPGSEDFKTRLQEQAARLGLKSPRYSVTATGPAHQRRFTARVCAGPGEGIGEGHTKKDAEQRAAQAAYSALASETAS